MNTRHPFRGRVEVAEYHDTGIQDYQGHPLIECLPPILEDEEAIRMIKNIRKFNPDERLLSPSKRRHCIERLRSFVVPLSYHIDLQQDISELIRQGYVSRNLRTNDDIRRMRNVMMGFKNEAIANLEKKRFFVPAATSSGIAVIGISGAGKTTGINRVLNLYPQIIIHPEYEEKQLVWVKVDCPVTGTVKQLCLGLIKEMGDLFGEVHYENYARYRTDELIVLLASLAMRYHLGVLVIDEIQYLNEARSGGAALMLNFFNTLINTIGVPVVLIGTPKAKDIFAKEFRNTKRVTNQGSIYWDRLQMDSTDWTIFLSQLWKHQWTQIEVELTEEFNRIMYEESQGIPDVAVKIYIESQKKAIEEGEKLTPSIISSVAQKQFKILQPALNALRSGKKRDLIRFLDIFLSDSPKRVISLSDKKEFEKQFSMDLDTLLSEQEEENDLDEIVTWLMDAGITEDVARKVAEKSKCEDKDKWRAASFQEAILPTKNEQNDKVNAVRPQKREKKQVRQVGLVSVLNKHKKKKATSTSYDILKEAGYIQDPFNFLKLE